MNRNILVSGASSDLAQEFIKIASSSASVLAVSRSEINGSKLFARKDNNKYIGGMDLTNEDDVSCLAKEVGTFFDNPFSAVHFAGDFWVHKPFTSTDFSEIKSLMDSHYVTLCGVAKAVTPHMKKVGGGRLVAFSCNSVGYNYPDLSPFTCPKAAIESFVKCYANEHSEFGISSTAIALPTMRTNKVLKEKPQGDIDNYISPAELGEILLGEILTQNNFVTGNIIKLFKHSETFYNQGYFERNPSMP